MLGHRQYVTVVPEREGKNEVNFMTAPILLSGECFQATAVGKDYEWTPAVFPNR